MRVSTTIITLDPKKAQKLLDNRAPNRPLDAKFATHLAGAIKDGKWELNGETIKINDKGEMEDGQHRCLAVVLAGQSIQTAVVAGLPSENGIFETIDTGKRRSLAHVFARSREENYAMLAAAVGWLWRFQRGAIYSFEKLRHDEAVRLLAEHPSLRESCGAVHCCRNVISPGVAAFLHYVFSRKDKELATWFFETLGSGEHLSKTSPKTSGILRLREILMPDRDKRSRRRAYDVIALTIKAWNSMRSGRVCKQLRWTTDEQFPEVE